MEFDHLIEYNVNVFHEKSYANCGRKTSLRSFSKMSTRLTMSSFIEFVLLDLQVEDYIVCVYILPPWRLLPSARCMWRAWRARINDLVLWIFWWVPLPSSFISVSKNVILFLQRQKFRHEHIARTGEKTI